MVTMEEAFGLSASAPPVSYKFYNGEVELFYDDAEHQYTRFTDAGELVIIPGVSSAVKIIDKSDALTQWAANQSCDYIREKMEAEQKKHEEICLAITGSSEGDPFHIEAQTVLSWLNDARFNFQKYKSAAADTGKIAHDWVERYIKAIIRGDEDSRLDLLGQLEEMPDERARNGAKAALDWMAKHEVLWVFTERKMYSRKHDFAGTSDGLAFISSCGDPECCGVLNMETGQKEAVFFAEALALIDWKTSNQLYVENEYQATAYLKATEEEDGCTIPLRVIIRLGKNDAKFESRLLMPETIERDFRTFLKCLDLYRDVNDRKRGEREVRNAVKALLKAKKEAEIAAEKQRKRDAKEALKLAKEAAYTKYRDQGMTVKAATAAVRAEFTTQEEVEEIAA